MSAGSTARSGKASADTVTGTVSESGLVRLRDGVGRPRDQVVLPRLQRDVADDEPAGLGREEGARVLPAQGELATGPLVDLGEGPPPVLHLDDGDRRPVRSSRARSEPGRRPSTGLHAEKLSQSPPGENRASMASAPRLADLARDAPCRGRRRARRAGLGGGPSEAPSVRRPGRRRGREASASRTRGGPEATSRTRRSAAVSRTRTGRRRDACRRGTSAGGSTPALRSSSPVAGRRRRPRGGSLPWSS